MKKTLALLLVMAMSAAPCAMAEENTATALPYGVTFEMDAQAVTEATGGDYEDYEGGSGVVTLMDSSLNVVELNAGMIEFEITTNNSERVPRLETIMADLPTGGNSILAFRKALAAMTAVYGRPDGDPFDAGAVQSYVEYGGLNATWTKADVRINLSLSRLWGDRLSLDFANRMCFNPEDLNE